MKTSDLHALMLAQATERRDTGRPMGNGDLVQDEPGSYREVVVAGSAGELLDALAHRQIWKRGSTAEACAMYGGSRMWNRGE